MSRLLTLLILPLLLTTTHAVAGGPQLSLIQQTRKIMMGKQLYINWDHAEFRSTRDENASWIKLPPMGQVRTQHYQIPSNKKKGSFKLPKKCYLDETWMEQEAFSMTVRYEYLNSGDFRLQVLDNIMEMDGLFAFDITIKWTGKNKGTATGTIFVPSNSSGCHIGEIRGISCELR